MKKFLLLVLSFTMIFALVGCTNAGVNEPAPANSNNSGSNTSGEKVDENKAPEPVTLRMAWWGGQPRHDYTLKVIEMYEAANPHVNIEAEFASWDDYWQKLAPQAAANEMPDIIQMDLSYLTQYAEKGQLEDLTPFLGKEIDTANISDSAISGGKLGDAIYGFNLGVNTIQFQYNPELLKSTLGIDSIDPNWTWDDYAELSRQAGEKGVYFDTGLKEDVFFHYFLRSHGKSLYHPTEPKLGYEDDALFVDFFGRLAGNVAAGGTPTPDVRLQSAGNIEDDPVVKGEAIGIFQWTNQFVSVNGLAPAQLEMVPLPGPNADKGLYLKPSMFFSVSKNSDNKAEAAKFISFFVNNVEANKLINGDRGVPVSSEVKEALKANLAPEQVKIFDFIAWAENNSSTLSPPDPLGSAGVMDALKSWIEKLDFGTVTPEEAAAGFRADAVKAMERAK
jgi:multiple sugar transport system substrate-binding protein